MNHLMNVRPEGALFCIKDTTDGIAVHPNEDGVVVFGASHNIICTDVLGKSIWKMVDNDDPDKEYAVFFPGITGLEEKEFELTIPGKVFDTSHVKTPCTDKVTAITIRGKNNRCDSAAVKMAHVDNPGRIGDCLVIK
jgi:hypothetical protein